MSKSLPLEAVKTMLKPVMHLIGKKADKEDVPDVSGYALKSELPDPLGAAYTHIETATIDGVNSLVRNFTDPFDGIQLDIEVPAGEAATGAAVEFYTANGLVSYMWMPSMIDTSAKYTRVRADKQHGEWVFEAMNPVNSLTQTSIAQKNANYVSADDAITKVVIYAASSAVFPTGTAVNIRTY